MLKFDFSGKKVLVTGAAQGIGKELVKTLYRCNAKVFALDRTQANLDSLQAECPGVVPVLCDLADIKSIGPAVGPHLPVDYLVNNAGVQVAESFLTVAEENLDKVMTINFKSVLFLSQLVANSMVKESLRGSIVNISSQAAQICLTNHTSYSCSKSAVDTLTRQMCFELGAKGIRVNSILPTVVMTEMGRKSWGDPTVAKPMLDRIPLGKFAEIHDVVNATMFLLSDAAAMITGAQLPVDGGATAS